MKAIRIHRHGGPETLAWDEVDVGRPGPGEVRVRNQAIGVNYTDVYFRNGAYAPPSLPFIPGNEGAGEIIAVGEGVEGFAPGDRVVYVEALGSYAEERLLPTRHLVRLPDAVSYDTAAAMMLKGLTAQYLVRRTFRVAPGSVVLVHAAAGGVGLLLTQWASRLGATVVGVVGSPEKARLAREHGCSHVIDRHTEDFVARVREITGGQGCDVVYDGVGRATYPGSLDCLRRFGMFVSYGAASGPITLDPGLLMKKGSLFATAPLLFDHIARREDLLAMTEELFAAVTDGTLRIPVHARLPLVEAAEAHRRLEAGETTGATVLLA